MFRMTMSWKADALKVGVLESNLQVDLGFQGRKTTFLLFEIEGEDLWFERPHLNATVRHITTGITATSLLPAAECPPFSKASPPVLPLSCHMTKIYVWNQI